jgi:HPr kinase/phosphorylase
VLIRGPSGAGKSRLVVALLQAAATGQLTFARLVSDDRSRLEVCHGRLLVRPAAELAGLIEVRGLGLRHLPHEPAALVGLLVDLAAPDGERLPVPTSQQTVIEGVAVSRLAIAPDIDPLPLVLARLTTEPMR